MTKRNKSPTAKFIKRGAVISLSEMNLHCFSSLSRLPLKKGEAVFSQFEKETPITRSPLTVYSFPEFLLAILQGKNTGILQLLPRQEDLEMKMQ